jgi:hypothetical protein
MGRHRWTYVCSSGGGCGKRAKRRVRETGKVKRINDRLSGSREARERSRSDEFNSVGRNGYE